MAGERSSWVLIALTGAGVGYTVLSLAWRRYLDLQIEHDEAIKRGDTEMSARLEKEIAKSPIGRFADRLFGF